MKWIRPIVLLLALPFGADAQLPPAEAEPLRAQRKLLSQEALAKIRQKEYRAAIPLLEECNRIQEKVGEINTPNTAVYFLYIAIAHTRLGAAKEARRSHEASLAIATQCAKAGVAVPETIFTSNWLGLGRLHRELGELTRALPYLQQYYKTKSKTLPAHHPTLIIIAGTLADVNRDLRRYRDAVAILQKHLPAAQAALPADSARLARMARMELRLAENLIDLGKHQEAAKHLQSGLASLEKNQPGMDLIIGLTVQATLHLARGEDAKVMPLYHRSQKLLAKLDQPTHPMHANLMSLISNQQLKQGHTFEALKTVNKAVMFVRDTLGKKHPRFAQILSSQATVMTQAGQTERALRLFGESIDIYTHTHGPNSAMLCGPLQSQAQLFQRKGDFPKALGSLNRALQIARKELGKDHEETSLILASLAELRIAMQDFAAAGPLLDRSLEIHKQWYGADHTRTLAIRGERAFLMELNKQFAKAHAEYLAIRKIQLTDHGEDAKRRPGTLRNLMRLARTAGELGNRDESLGHYNTVLDLTRQNVGPIHNEVAIILSNLARLHFQFDEFPAAVKRQQEAIELLRRINLKNDPAYLNQLANLATMHRFNQQPELELKVLTEMLTRQREHFQQVLSHLGEADALNYLQGHQRSVTLFQSACAAAAPHSPEVARLGAEQLALSKASLEEIRWAQSRVRTQSPAVVGTLTAHLASLRHQLDHRKTQPNLNPEDLTEAIRERAKLEAELRITQADLASAIAKSDAQVARHLATNRLGLDDLARKLPPDGVLIDLVRYNQLSDANQPAHPRYAAYLTFARVAGKVTRVHRIDLGPAAPIDQAITELHRLIHQKLIAPRRIDPVIATLSQLVGTPLWEATPNAKHLLICPDAQLGRLPFELLKTDDGYWLDHKTISYLGSGRELARMENAPPAPLNPAIVFGAADFGTPNPPAKIDRHFQALPHSKAETQAIAAALGPETKIFTGPQATETHLKKIKQPRVLHLSSHAYYLRTIPQLELPPGEIQRPHASNPLLRCGIALAGANTALTRSVGSLEEDGLLTGLEAAHLNLHGTGLVILSACQSSVGDIHAGEGAMSLRRAFGIAGAQAVLASHWPVSDQATQALMQNFTAHWQSGMSRTAALRKAQLELRQSEDHASPFFWAAFTLTGQWR